MELEKSEAKIIVDYFNSMALVPSEVRMIANKMREVIYPEVVVKEVKEEVEIKKVAKKKK